MHVLVNVCRRAFEARIIGRADRAFDDEPDRYSVSREACASQVGRRHDSENSRSKSFVGNGRIRNEKRRRVVVDWPLLCRIQGRLENHHTRHARWRLAHAINPASLETRSPRPRIARVARTLNRGPVEPARELSDGPARGGAAEGETLDGDLKHLKTACYVKSPVEKMVTKAMA